MKIPIGNNRGIALILVLTVISIILVVTLNFNSDMRSDLTAAANMRDSITVGCAARSGFNLGLALLAKDADDNDFDTLGDDWAKAGALSEGAVDLEGFEGINLQLGITDCSAKIQINNLVDKNGSFVVEQKDLLKRFLSLSSFDLDSDIIENMIDSLKDWLDPDDDTTGFSGAEDAYYQLQDPPYACCNGRIRLISSLRGVRGFADIPKPLFDDIVRYMTQYGGGKININTADPLVLQALSDRITPDLSEAIDEYRREDGNNLSDPSWYKKVPGIGDITIPETVIDTKSAVFQVDCMGGIDVGNGRTSFAKKVSGIVRRVVTDGKKGIDVLSFEVE